MAVTERPEEFDFDGTTPVTLGTWSTGVSTLLNFRAVSDQAPDRELTIQHRQTAGPVLTPLVKATIFGTDNGAKGFAAGTPIGALNASGESIEAFLDGAGTFKCQVLWLDRT